MVNELERIEHDPEIIVLMYPAIAVWGINT